ALNWNVPRTVTVTGVDDALVDGDIAYSIITSVTSADADYAAINPADVSVVNLDNDEPSSPPTTRRPQRPASTPVPPPPTPACDLFCGASDTVLRATVSGERGYGLFCRMIYENGAPSPAI